MKHSQRRQKAGEMLMDVTKYLLTIGLISGILTDKLTPVTAIFISLAVIISFVIAFFVIPPKMEE
ncbi:MAG: hypothetical protein HZA78_03880 [Candidatus Schekmanbacteria bacterium]|nr:hypothetical protein [Candidatus Schekmanbacteria bacterium]